MQWLSDLIDWFKSEQDSLEASEGSPDLSIALILEAQKWIGIHERKGESDKGVNVFRKAVDGRSSGEAWCAAFVQYCCVAVATRFKKEISIAPSELCSSIWSNTPKKYRLDAPEPGCVVVWNYPGTIHGHIGIVIKVEGDYLQTIEGNTKSPSDQSTSGTGVYQKTRSIHGGPGMNVLGFLKPFK